jgi:hypothetical protein
MEILILYLIGVLILGVSHYIYMICVSKEEILHDSKKLIAYKSFKFGLTSWLGIIIVIAVILTGFISYLDELIEDKLS